MAELSLLGNVVEDVHQLIHGLHRVNICCTRRGANRVAHVIAQHARNISICYVLDGESTSTNYESFVPRFSYFMNE